MLALDDAPALDAEEEQGLPRAMICPITTRFMRDPVVTSEGQSYERRALGMGAAAATASISVVGITITLGTARTSRGRATGA